MKSKGQADWSRREFLAMASVALAAGCVGSRPGAGPAAWRPRLSTSTVQFSTVSIEAACERIAGLGFEAVDIWCAYDGCPHLDDALNRLGGEGLRALLERTGLELCGFSTYVGGYAKYAALLGAAGGGVAIQGSGPPCAPAELTVRMKGFLEGLKPLVELAEANRSWLAIENHGQALLDGLDSLKAFTDLNTSPRLGIALAPYHLQAISASVPEAIGICGSQLAFFYAWQQAPGLGQLPGHGPVDMGPWLEALRRIDYGRHVNPFMHGHPEPDAMGAALRVSRDYLLRLAAV